MHAERRPSECSAFTEDEIRKLRSVGSLLNWILILFAAIIILIFIPFNTVSDLSEKMGSLTAIVTEQKQWLIMDREKESERIRQLEESYSDLEKKIYWINRNSRESNEKITILNKNLAAFFRLSSNHNEVIKDRTGP